MTDELISEYDIEPVEKQEWQEALLDVLESYGAEQTTVLLQELMKQVGRLGLSVPGLFNTSYINSIPKHLEQKMPDDKGMLRRICNVIRWNAVAMVLRAGDKAPELGGHIASYASAATLYEVGFNYFFRGITDNNDGDLLYIQGHSSPGIYARAFLEGRLSEEQLEHFRQEVDADGLSSYPHPHLMSDFWQFPTVSMGLGALQAIYQARFMKYLANRELLDVGDRKVWAFLGDGEMDEPESLGALTVAAREGLDNLIFVVNCNLQRLDGPVRGNGKIIQELEGIFLGAGWRVIKVVWGSGWDVLLEKDESGLLLQRMQECVDGDFQAYKANGGAYIREHFFGRYPELKALVADMSDDDIDQLRRGGHDPQKVYAAYHEAFHHKGQPVVILAKTVKGYGMGEAGEGQNTTHQQKKMTPEQLEEFCKRFELPIDLEKLTDIPFYKPPADSEEIIYLREQREKLGGYLPSRRAQSIPLTVPKLDVFQQVTQGSGDRAISTTMAFVRLLNLLLRDKQLGKHIVPIIPDECRTFGMEGMFRQYGIYSSVGQLYTPEDADQIMCYKESRQGQILEEGITEAGAFCSWMAAATSYSSHDLPMIPFYIYYSMFGFQRIGDLAWAAGDMHARGFLLGGTAGRTTLAGEGLQHQDGQSHVLSSLIPNCVSYDPCFAYELAVIIQDGLHRMYSEQEDVFYYISLMNENYHQPAMPDGVEQGIINGMYLLRNSKGTSQIQLLGSGAILQEVIKAAECLQTDFSIHANVWSVTSFTELAREAANIERYNRLHSAKDKKISYVTQCFADHSGPVVAASDYVRLFADQIRAYVPHPYVALGTDGFGRSDTRAKLRHFFEVDAKYIVLAAVDALVQQGELPARRIADVFEKYGIEDKKDMTY